MSSSRQLAVLILLLATMVPSLRAQGETVMDRKAVELLIEMDFSTDAIIAYLKDRKRTLALTAIDLRFMEKRKVDPVLITWLRQRIKETPDKLTVASVLEAWKKNQDAQALMKLIRRNKRPINLSVTETIQLLKAGVPEEVIKALRESGDAAIPLPVKKEELPLDAIVLMAHEKKSDEEIIAAIKASGTEYDVDTATIVSLREDGLSVSVLREIYRRRRKTPETRPTSRPGPAMTRPSSPEAPAMDSETLELYRDTGRGISLLKPANFVVTKEFQGSKALVQMVAPREGSEDDLPDLELSYMIVIPRKSGNRTIRNADLEPIARSFAEGLRDRFARDGISMKTGKPVYTWISSERALRIGTQAQVRTTQVGYVGASWLLYHEGRILVFSYSMRLEKAHEWRPVLEDCIHSVVLGNTPPEFQMPEGLSRRDQVLKLFETWRRAIRRSDFATWRSLFEGMADTARERQAFLNMSSGINETGKRVEVGGVDFENHLINYHVFSVDGVSARSLPFAKGKKGWILTRTGN